jgi:putative flippase GtrA
LTDSQQKWIKALIAQKLRYILVGGIVYFTDILVFWIFINVVSDKYLIANLTAKFIAATLGFFLHDRFTFNGDKTTRVTSRIIKYITLFAGNSLFATLLLFSFVDLGKLDTFYSKIGVDILVIIIAFVISRKLIFK